jgi:hypothetical protein
VIQARFQADFTDASLRIATLKSGLKLIYAYDLVLRESEAPFDDTLLAIRGALEWLVKFSSLEQNYVLPVSLHALPDCHWDRGLSRDQHSGSWQFTIPETLFPSQAHVRLRGISAEVECDGDRSLFQCAIRVPELGSIRYLDGSTQNLDQRAVPTTRIGRVYKRDAIRPADTVGVLSLHNVSPIGTWKLAITSSQFPPRTLRRLTHTIGQ